MPLSVTAITPFLPSLSIDMVIEPPSGVYLKALESRLAITLSKCMRSIHSLRLSTFLSITRLILRCSARKTYDFIEFFTYSVISVSLQWSFIWFLSIFLSSSIWFTSSNRRWALWFIVSIYSFPLPSPMMVLRRDSGPRISVNGERMSCVALMRNCIFASSSSFRLCLRYITNAIPTTANAMSAYIRYATVVLYQGCSTSSTMVFVFFDTIPLHTARTSRR